jgi:hypothetical protein
VTKRPDHSTLVSIEPFRPSLWIYDIDLIIVVSIIKFGDGRLVRRLNISNRLVTDGYTLIRVQNWLVTIDDR